MNIDETTSPEKDAPGSPGIPPTWTSSDKDLVGAGRGRAWPLSTEERGRYEVSAGVVTQPNLPGIRSAVLPTHASSTGDRVEFTWKRDIPGNEISRHEVVARDAQSVAGPLEASSRHRETG